jgi:hypothetical protein
MTAAFLPEIGLFALLSLHMTQHSPGATRVLFFEFVDPSKISVKSSFKVEILNLPYPGAHLPCLLADRGGSP